ncbi:MAG: DUF5683 domain-containing protein [Oceanihabitans sp.]
MINKFFIASILSLFICFSAIAQEEKNATTKKQTEQNGVVIEGELDRRKPIDPLTPARAAFYSAVLPGLGQAYNKKYWKIPIIYAALGAGTYFYLDNDKEYKRYRNAYKRRLAGFEDDEFFGSVTDDGLREAQKTFRRNKELSLLITIGLYALNIVDANVDGHLLQYNVDDNLTLQPHYKLNEFDNTGDLGLSVNFKF